MIRSRLLSLTVAVMVLEGCGHGAPPLRASPLVVKDAGDGAAAYVTALVAGEPTFLLLDTGAVQHTIPRSVARARGLRSDDHAIPIADANGKTVWVGTVRNVPVLFEGETRAVELDFVENPFTQGNVGVLAVHKLLGRGWAMVVDFDGKELRFDPEEVALARAREKGPLQEVSYSTCMLQGFGNEHRIVSAEVNGVEADMLLDTGAVHTALAPNNPALRKMMSTLGSTGQAVGMFSVGNMLMIDDVPVRFAGASFSVSATVTAGKTACWEGMLGVDLLRHCTLVWGYRSLWAGCRPAGAKGEGGRSGPTAR